MKLGLLQGALCKEQRCGLGAGLQIQTAGRVGGHPMWKATRTLFLPAALDGGRGWSAGTPSSNSHSTGVIAGRFLPWLSYLDYERVCSSGEVSSQPAASLNRRGKGKHRVCRGPPGQPMLASACQGDLAWGIDVPLCCVWKWRAHI